MILFPELLPLTPAAGGAYLHIKVTPKAAQRRWGGLYAQGSVSMLKVFVKEPPEKGRANEAVMACLSEDLGIPKSRLKLVHGHTGKCKKIFIEGAWEEIAHMIQKIL